MRFHASNAEAGNVQAQHGLEIQHDREHLDIENEQVFGWYIHTAEKGYVWAQLFLAEEFRHGLVIGENSNYSAYWFRMAAKQGEAKAQWQLGLMYWTGQGVEQSDEQAEYWLLKAAEQDFPEAQYDLAQFFGEIVGLDEDFLRWMNRAAELGYGPAQYYLAEFDDYLPDDERDDLLEKSLAWYEERAEQGDAKMQYEYARLHLDEKNWRADRGIGLHFLNMAAEQHHPLACRR